MATKEWKLEQWQGRMEPRDWDESRCALHFTAYRRKVDEVVLAIRTISPRQGEEAPKPWSVSAAVKLAPKPGGFREGWLSVGIDGDCLSVNVHNRPDRKSLKVLLYGNWKGERMEWAVPLKRVDVR